VPQLGEFHDLMAEAPPMLPIKLVSVLYLTVDFKSKDGSRKLGNGRGLKGKEDATY
jgi:hypothetical protein